MHSVVKRRAGDGPGGASLGPPGWKGKPGKGPLYHIEVRKICKSKFSSGVKRLSEPSLLDWEMGTNDWSAIVVVQEWEEGKEQTLRMRMSWSEEEKREKGESVSIWEWESEDRRVNSKGGEERY